MATENKELQTQEVEKQEITTNGAERTRARKAYVPRADIFETKDAVVVVADMPGVDENTIDITLEKGVLSINGFVEQDRPDNYSLAYAEYEVGDYFRRFTLSNEVDQENIQATVKNGVLRLHLPKVGPAQAKKISVKAA
ncbi:MAG: Hsp20/alpha crystallin family protein [Anaerolineales bacterium]|nr:Hsp20/alpha crystallin family protein [Anaerolineales bacterium]